MISLLIIALVEPARAQAPRFFADDPIQALPAPVPVKTPRRQNFNENLDLLSKSRTWKPGAAKPAAGVNTLGEVPDSDWFVNRHARKRLSRDELQRGPVFSEPPVPPFTVTGGKDEGVSAGFQLKDSKGRSYFAKIDPESNPELVTAADVIVSKFLYAIGYNTPQNQIVNLKLSDLHLSDKAVITPQGERPRKMTWDDFKQIVRRAAHYPDGSFRIMASLAIEGKYVGPFLYEGTRNDDPNDIVPHENRRDLRGLGVFYAWLNNTDVKPSNTLDTVVVENGVRFIRHYIFDFGNSLGSDGDAAKDPRLGYEYLFPTPTAALKKIVTLGLFPTDWEREHYQKLPGIGNFDSRLFNPDEWKPGYPNPAFMNRLPDDDYWAAKQVIAFTDDNIRAIVETARFSDPRSTEFLSTTLAQRRDKIAKIFFAKILPLDHFRVENDDLLFDDLAVQYGFHALRPYEVRWSKFDNIQHTHDPVQGSTSRHLPPEIATASSGSYFCAAIAVPGDPLKPVSVYLRKEPNGFKVVGIDRAW